MNEMYTSGEYASKNPNWHLEHSPFKATQVSKMLAKHAIKPRRLMEVGCGVGGILEELRNRLDPKPECVGYDVSPQAIEFAAKREGEGLKFFLGTPDPKAGRFDVALAMDVAEHVEDYLAFIRGLKELAEWKILHIPMDLSMLSVARPSYLSLARQHVGHLHYFTLETALASVEQAGLEVKDWFLTSVELEQGAPGQKRLQFVRRMMNSWKPELTARILGGYSVLVLCK
jgi:hypothetical protein